MSGEGLGGRASKRTVSVYRAMRADHEMLFQMGGGELERPEVNIALNNDGLVQRQGLASGTEEVGLGHVLVQPGYERTTRAGFWNFCHISYVPCILCKDVLASSIADYVWKERQHRSVTACPLNRGCVSIELNAKHVVHEVGLSQRV